MRPQKKSSLIKALRHSQSMLVDRLSRPNSSQKLETFLVGIQNTKKNCAHTRSTIHCPNKHGRMTTDASQMMPRKLRSMDKHRLTTLPASRLNKSVFEFFNSKKCFHSNHSNTNTKILKRQINQQNKKYLNYLNKENIRRNKKLNRTTMNTEMLTKRFLKMTKEGPMPYKRVMLKSTF